MKRLPKYQLPVVGKKASKNILIGPGKLSGILRNGPLTGQLTAYSDVCLRKSSLLAWLDISFLFALSLKIFFILQERSNRHLFSRHDNRNAHSDMGDLETYFGMVGCFSFMFTQHMLWFNFFSLVQFFVFLCFGMGTV